MSNVENRRIEFNSLTAAQAGFADDAVSVLYAAPILLTDVQKTQVKNKYSEMIPSETSDDKNILNYQSDEKSAFRLVSDFAFLENIIKFGKFFKKISEEIKPYSVLHLFAFSSVSFLFQIIPLLILGKFFRKQVVIEFIDFKNYYLPEESGTVIRYFLKFADSVVVPTSHQGRALRQKSIQAVCMKVQTDIDNITPRVIENVQPLILASAYLENVFNIHCLLKSFRRVKQKYPRAELIISGSGSQKEHIENLISAKSISGVSLSSSEESEAFFNKVDVFVHCYHIEYFSQEILRAMAHGLPVMASPLGMVNNLIQKENILMYQFNDFSTLADNLLLLIEDDSLTKKLSCNGVKFVSNFTKANNKNSVISFYKNLS